MLHIYRVDYDELTLQTINKKFKNKTIMSKYILLSNKIRNIKL